MAAVSFFLFIFITTISTLFLTSTSSTIAANRNLTDGQTVISDDETFKMGFFSPTNNSTNRYFGIWYNKISVMTVVWVANRETPLTDTSGVLLLRDNGTLTLLNRTNNAIWSSNSSESGNNPVAKLLDTGNLVITNDGDRNLENYLWQSFDYPGNTFLPTMKFGIDYVRGLNKYLTAWKSDNDPSSGEYTNRFDSEGYPQIILRKGSEVVFNSGPWNGLRFSGMPNLKPNDIYTFGFELNSKELYYKYELVNNFTISRMILSTDGVIQRWIWIDRTQQWSLYLSAQMDNCDRFGLCGPYGVCNINNSPACGCLRGFVPRFPEEWRRADWSNGCMRKADLACDGVAAASGDGFVQMTGVKLPDTRKTWFNVSMGIEECGRVCLRDCNCTAYANIDVRTGSGCLIWLDDLVDIRVYGEGGQDVHVKMAASELRKIGFLKLEFDSLFMLGKMPYYTIEVSNLFKKHNSSLGCSKNTNEVYSLSKKPQLS